MSYRKKKRTLNGRVQHDLQQTTLTGMNADLQSTEELLSTGELSSVGPEEILRRGKADFSTNKAALRFARVILSNTTASSAEAASSPTASRAEPLYTAAG